MKPLDIIQARAEAAAFLHEREHDGDDVFLSTDKAAEFVGSPSRAAFRIWAQRHGLTPVYYGRLLRFSKLDLRAELHRQARRRGRG